MINELYIYACPKLPNEQEQPFNVLHILCITLFSSLSLFFGNIALSMVIMILYVGLSLLTFLDKDIKSRYMKFITLCVVDVSIVGMYIIAKTHPNYRVIFWSILFALIFSVIYEVVFFIKVRKNLYSSPSRGKKTTGVVSAFGVLIFTLSFRILKKIPIFKNLVVSILVLLGGAMLVVSVISVQKLIIYLYTREKMIDEEEVTSNIKKTHKLLIALITLTVVLSVCFILITNISKNYTKFCFNQETLKYVFADEVSSAESFCENKGAGTILYNRYKYAKANDDGTLTVIVDNETLRLWKSNNWTLQILESLLEETGKSAGVDIDWSEDFLNAKRDVKDCGVEISEDYSLIIQGPDDDGSFYTFLLPACIYMQIFEGKQVDEIKVTYVEVDESGNVIDEINWELPPNNQS